MTLVPAPLPCATAVAAKRCTAGQDLFNSRSLTTLHPSHQNIHRMPDFVGLVCHAARKAKPSSCLCNRPNLSGLGVPRCTPRATHDVRQGVAIAFVPSGLLFKSLGVFLKPLRMARLFHRALKLRLGHGPSRWGNTTISVVQWPDSPKTKVLCPKSLIM